MTIQTWVARTTTHFHERSIETTWLDALLLLEHASQKDRAWLLAHTDDLITELLSIEQLEWLVAAVARRANHEPIAYITGHKEFYGLDLIVDKHVLVPRPESEDMITMLLALHPATNQHILDIGTGSGALATAAKHVCPQAQVSGVDISKKALTIARQNAANHNVTINFYESDLLESVNEKQDYILANLPYVPPGFAVNEDVLHEPALAVFAEDDGLELITRLLATAPAILNPGGYVLIESLPEQMHRISAIAYEHGFTRLQRSGFIQLFQLTANHNS